VSYIFVTGGASSGKSRFALERFKGLSKVAFIATGVSTDPEMEERIRNHRRERPAGWDTIEEPLDLIGALARVPRESEGVIIDCLTLWVSNLLYERSVGHGAVLSLAEETAGRLEGVAARALVVTNELGFGVIPANEECRLFRKLAGEVNQVFALKSAEAWLVVSGIGMRLK